jgi:WD40 repeat protein
VVAVADPAAPAAVPAGLEAGAVAAALVTVGAAVPARVIALADGVSRSMFASNGKIATALFLALGLAATGFGVFVYQAWAARQTDVPAAAAPGPAEGKADEGQPPQEQPTRGERPGALRFRSAHTIYTLDYSADGTKLIGADRDNIAHVWDAATGKELHRVKFEDEWPSAFAAAPDGKVLATGGRKEDRKIRLWDAATGREVFQSAALEGAVGSLCFAPDGKTLAAAAGKGIRLWDVATGKEQRPLAEAAGPVWHLRFSPDGKLLAGAYEIGGVRLWDLATRQEVQALSMPGWVVNIAFSQDGTLLAAGGPSDKDEFGFFHDQKVFLWDVATGKEVRRLQGQPDFSWPLAFAPDGKTLATAEQDGKIRLFDVATGKERQQILVAEQHGESKPSVMALAFAPDGKVLASAGTGQIVRRWDMVTGKEIPISAAEQR